MLNLYKNVTPNLSGTHYYFKDFSKYVSLLASNLFKQIDNKRYDINKGFIRVKLGTDLTEENYKQVTYILNTTDNMCYHVTSQIVQSEYAYYGVNVDLWASYIVNAKLKNINVRKCNRKISDNGIYDNIEVTNDLNIIDFGLHGRRNDYIVVIFAKVYPSNDETNGTTIEPFCCKLGDIGFREKLYDFLSELTGYRWFYYNEGVTPTAMKLSKVYLFHKDYFEIEEDPYCSISPKKTYSETWNIKVYRIKNNYKVFNYELDSNINKKSFVGGVSQNLIVYNKVTNKINISFTFAVGSDDLKVIVSDGNNERDIAKSFELPAIQTEPQQDSFNEISRYLGITTGFIQMYAGLFSGSPLSFSRGVSSLARGIEHNINLDRQLNLQNSSLASTGDAFVTYNGEISGTKDNIAPFKIFTRTSSIDEMKRARKTGANFNEYIETIESIFDKELLGTGESNDDTYVVASLDANEIPTSAVDYIEGRFASGIYLQYIV